MGGMSWAVVVIPIEFFLAGMCPPSQVGSALGPSSLPGRCSDAQHCTCRDRTIDQPHLQSKLEEIVNVEETNKITAERKTRHEALDKKKLDKPTRLAS
jgi:hypothetical protein